MDYVLREGPAFTDVLAAAERREAATLFVLGAGFDPRTCTALRALVDRRGSENLHIARLELRPPAVGGVEQATAERNRREIEMIGALHGARLTDLPWPVVADPSSAGPRIIRDLIEGDHLNGIDQVIVDISALPRGVYFSVLGGLLQLAHDGRFDGDLHAVVCDNPALDDVILEEGAEAPGTLGGFSGRLEEARSITRQPIVWAPVIGPRKLAQLRSLLTFLDPNEICPVLPFPAADPRRPDDLVLEYREFLFGEEADVGPRNFIYAAEANPFDLYRTLGDLQARYRDALAPLGGATVALSAHSSKLLSIGVLLAAYEHRLPVVHVFPTRYYIAEGADVDALADYDHLTDLWLAGEPYR